ncbi:MAG: (Fe-S)-binding protein [Planctomycetes bacterium]|nr:(Fe-S)-binding protein [Planctomycetota bacterium]
MKVSLFTTCLTDTFLPRVAVATVRLLRHLGCEVDFPVGQTCCGQMYFNSGYHQQAKRVGRTMLEVFSESEYVVCPSASCVAMIRDYYEELFENESELQGRVKELIGKTFELTEFLDGVLKVDFSQYRLEGIGRVTYHHGCHNRGLGQKAEQVIGLIQAIAGLEYLEPEKMDQCCGFGGAFAVKMEGISASLASDKSRCLAATGADRVVINEGGCWLQIAGYSHREGVAVRPLHIAELLAESLGLMDGEDGL